MSVETRYRYFDPTGASAGVDAAVGHRRIIDSPQYQSVVAKIRTSKSPEESDVTTFQTRDGESLAMACERIVQSLDEHCNEHSQTPGYTELNVIGVSLGEVSLGPFLQLNFDEFARTATGFIAKKVQKSGA